MPSPAPQSSTHCIRLILCGVSKTRRIGGKQRQGAIKQVLATPGLKAEDIEGVGLTGQMHGLVLLDRNGRVLRPAILWNDQRTGPQCAEITARAGGLERLVQLTGNAVLPGFTAPKILWVS